MLLMTIGSRRKRNVVVVVICLIRKQYDKFTSEGLRISVSGYRWISGIGIGIGEYQGIRVSVWGIRV